VIRVDKVWLAVDLRGLRDGCDTALARAGKMFGADIRTSAPCLADTAYRTNPLEGARLMLVVFDIHKRNSRGWKPGIYAGEYLTPSA
jgi:hypothetical protein